MRQPTKLFLGSLAVFITCALTFEDCDTDSSEPYRPGGAADAPGAAYAERSGAAVAPLLAARSELEKVTEERDALRSRLSLFHLDGEINQLVFEPGDAAAAQPLHLEDE